jgi:hypothetical protein
MRHVNEHRQALTKQMEENVLSTYDQLRHDLAEQNTTLDIHQIMKQIDEWEQQSIDKIHQVAAILLENNYSVLLTNIRTR